MAIWDLFRASSPASRRSEEALYAQVMGEIRSGVRRDGLWAKALVTASGNETEATAVYIKLRVQAIKDEAELANTTVVLVATTDIDAALIEAAAAGDLKRCERLVTLGAKPFLVDESGFSACDYARARSHSSVVKYFRSVEKV
jgi:hypothetical protein